MRTNLPQWYQEGLLRGSVEKAVTQVNRTLSMALDTIQQIYSSNHLQFKIDKDYALRIFMNLVAPVDLQLKYNAQDLKQPIKKDSSKIAANQETESSKNVGQSKFSNIPERTLQQKQQREEHRPQMMSILNKIKSSRDQSKKYYKYPNTYPLNDEIDKKRNKLVYPSLRIEQEYSDNQMARQRCVLGTRLEKQIGSWIAREIARGRKITRDDLQLKAVQLRQNPNFKASRSWVSSYFRRYPEMRKLIMQCQAEEDDESDSRQQQNESIVSKSAQNQSSYESYLEEADPQGHKKIRQSPVSQIDRDQKEGEAKEEDKAVYQDGEKKIIIYKGITNEIKQSNYTIGRRVRKSYVNGNGYNFKNHSRFKDAYFNELSKSKLVNSVVIVKSSDQNQKKNAEGKTQNEEKQSERNQSIRADTMNDNSKNNSQSGDKLRRYLNLMKHETQRWKPSI